MNVSAGGRLLAIEIKFSCHCFTEKSGPQDPPDLMYRHAHEVRKFDLVRYELSKRLPQLIKELPGKSVYRSKTHSFFFLRQTEESQIDGPYVVFFNIRKSKTAGIDLHMHVESAYPKPNMTVRASAVRFETLAVSCLNGRDIPHGPLQIIKRK